MMFINSTSDITGVTNKVNDYIWNSAVSYMATTVTCYNVLYHSNNISDSHDDSNFREGNTVWCEITKIAVLNFWVKLYYS